MTEMDVILHWKKSARDALDASKTLFETGKYQLSLFTMHLAIEKGLKALWMENHRTEPPKTHDLLQLSKKLECNWSEKEWRLLGNLTEFSVAARYDDPFWAEKEATHDRTAEWLKDVEMLLTTILQ